MQNKKVVLIGVGFFTVLSLAGLFFLGFKASNLGSFRPDSVYEVRALFADASGLGKDARVSMAGVQIGRVAKIALSEDNDDAVVVLQLDAQYRLPKDSTAQILTAGLLGERYVGVSRGVASESLADGDVLTHTKSALMLEKMLQQFTGNGSGFYPDSTYTLTARFADATGLSVDTPVTQSGVQIGRVANIALDQKSFQAVVKMEIATQYNHIPLDSSADILSSSLLGGKYIGISPGGEMIALEDGDEFQYSNSSVVLERVIQQFISNMTMKQ